MRLTLVISSLAGGGAERALSEMANYWAQRAHRLTIITWDQDRVGDAYRVDPRVMRMHLGVQSHSAGWLNKLSSNFSRIAVLRRALAETNADLILSFMDSTNVTVILASRGLRVPVIVAVRSDPAANTLMPVAWRILRRWTYRWADRVIAQTQSAARWLNVNCGVEAIVISNLLRDVPAPSASVMREKCIVAVGRLAWEKDIETLIRAFARVHERHCEWRLVLVGDGPFRDELMTLSALLGVYEATSFEGFLPDPEAWMARAGVFVLSSRFEGFPNAMLEAMSMGATVVASDCPSGPREILTDRINGRLFRVGDVDGLAAILDELIVDEDQRWRLGAAAAQVRSRYSADNIMRQWDEVIRTAVGAAL